MLSQRTDSDARSEDRYPTERSSTPLLPLENIDRAHEALPEGLPEARRREYLALRERGASHGMCATFALSFSQSSGIVARMPVDSDLRADFAGPEMREGDVWEIQLGRRTLVDGDDPNGAQFVEGLLEDILLFPLRLERGTVYWETVRDYARDFTWITRPMPRRLISRDDMDDPEDSDSLSEKHYEEGYDEQFTDADVPQAREVDEGYPAYGPYSGCIPDNVNGWDNSCSLYEAALDCPDRVVNNGPVIEENVYESDTPSMHEEEDYYETEGEDQDVDQFENVNNETTAIAQSTGRVSASTSQLTAPAHAVEPNAQSNSVSTDAAPH